MHYCYSPPVAATHTVRWDRQFFPGIYVTRKERFASTTLCRELREWLDVNAPGWSFSADWDGFSTGGDDDGCQVRVSSREEGEGFAAVARAASARWVEEDRRTMAYRLILTTTKDGEIEITRGHHIGDVLIHDKDLDRHLVLDEMPMRQRIYRAMRKASTSIIMKQEPNGRVEVDLMPDDVRAPGTSLAYVKVAVERMPDPD